MIDRPRSEPTRILIADSQAVIRMGVRLALEERRDLRVVAEACDLESAMKALEAARPHVAVVEMDLPGDTAPGMIRRFLDQPRVGLVMLSASNDPEALTGALALGVRSILSKSSPVTALVDAIRAVRWNAPWTPPRLEARLAGEEESEEVWAGLTPRERDVASLVASGLPYREVAERLEISDHTVKNHLRRIYDKLDINSRVELAVHGARERD
jgi:two-component system NarL family response regulator